MDYHFNLTKYRDILEFIPQKANNKNLTTSELFSCVDTFLQEHAITNVLVSLSGGVDSMVLLEIFHKIRETRRMQMNNTTFDIICCHMNYKNREESDCERDFLIEYCKSKDVIFNYKDLDFKRMDSKRSDYEKETRNIRYSYYEELCKQYNCTGVFLAHHKGDTAENIFNNIMRGGREITDLSVLKKKNNILNVNVFRPLLDYYKQPILDIAEEYSVPYFLDSTPDWSCRGKMRRAIFPACEDCYGDSYTNNLIKLGNESDTIGNIIENHIIEPLLNETCFEDSNIILKKTNVLREYYVMKLLMKQICHTMGIENIRQKNVEQLILHFDEIGKKMTLMKNYVVIVREKDILFQYLVS